MSLDIIQNPEVFSGFIEEFGFHKIERQTKIVVANILRLYFSKNATLFRSTTPEIQETDNSETETKIFIEKDFPFYQRKLPLIAITSQNKVERKPFLGTDDFLYQDYHIDTSTGFETNVNMYANMYDVPIIIVIAALSSEERMQLQELVNICFTHYFRWEYMYKGLDGSFFNIVPSGGPLTIGSEGEVKDVSSSTLVYTTSISFTSIIEYIFGEVADNAFMFRTIGVGPVDPASSDFRWWEEDYDDEDEEYDRQLIEFP